MELNNIESIRQKNKLIICGHGKSLDNILKDLPNYAKDYEIMTLNDWYNIDEYMPVDYVVCSSPNSPLYPGYINKLDPFITYFFKYNEIITTKPEFDTEKIKYFSYRFRQKGGYDLQTALVEKTKGQMATSGASTIILCLNIAILMGYKEIYYIGVELDSRYKYAGNKNHKRKWMEPADTWEKLIKEMDYWRPSILEDMRKIHNSAYNINISMVDMTYMSKEQIRKIL